MSQFLRNIDRISRNIKVINELFTFLNIFNNNYYFALLLIFIINF